jgi:predicted aspartyl protease
MPNTNSVNGTYNASGNPTIAIEVSGPLANKFPFTAMVDTGFSGFLLLPILNAFPIGLLLQGTMPITLADGSTQTKLTCLGSIHFDGAEEIGIIIIEWQNTDVLVGMEFLSRFGKQLLVDPTNGIVEIINAPAPPPPPAPIAAPPSVPPSAPPPVVI